MRALRLNVVTLKTPRLEREPFRRAYSEENAAAGTHHLTKESRHNGVMIQPGSTDVIAVLGGSGQQGQGLAQRFAHAGLRVIVGSRDPERARETVARWPTTGQPSEVAGNAEIGRAHV